MGAENFRWPPYLTPVWIYMGRRRPTIESADTQPLAGIESQKESRCIIVWSISPDNDFQLQILNGCTGAIGQKNCERILIR